MVARSTPLLSAFISIFLLAGGSATASDSSGSASVPIAGDLPLETVPDLRNDKTKLSIKDSDVVVVPIPMSNPTFGTGLILGGAYFYQQTEAQKKVQPASFTGAAGIYTNNKSYAFGLGQQNYWKADSWRFTGVGGYADFKLDLRDPLPGSDSSVDWLVKGLFFEATLSRQIAKNWYLGGQLRLLDIEQAIDLNIPEAKPLLGDKIRSTGVGATLEYDTRDVPTNAYKGSRFTAKALASDTAGDSSGRYQSYFARYRYYYQTRGPIVIAADLNGCTKRGEFPLWDTCRLNLRGFPVTEYLGKTSAYGQVEGRWRAYKRLGFVAFAGWGYVGQSFSDARANQRVPSYGAGVRFMVLESKRVNFRVDYARSASTSAWYVAVGEAF